MEKKVIVKGVQIGEGLPKVCVPLTGESVERLEEEAQHLLVLKPDLVEWRADFFKNVFNLEKAMEALKKIREVMGETPLIFTFRTKAEGGQREIEAPYYVQLNSTMIKSGMVDLLDVELFRGEKEVQQLLETARVHDVYLILSNHDFEKTPPLEEIISRLHTAQKLGGDILKIAVMPRTKKDVLTLMEATLAAKERFADRPLVTMSMGESGMVSRIAGGVFGSALTFGSAGSSSAPGQIPAAELRKTLQLMHPPN